MGAGRREIKQRGKEWEWGKGKRRWWIGSEFSSVYISLCEKRWFLNSLMIHVFIYP